MFGYYLQLALRSFRRHKALTTLMVLTIAAGIGAAMTTLSIYFVLSGNPLPHKSDRLFSVQVDARPQAASASATHQDDPEPPELITDLDADLLLAQDRALRQTATARISAKIMPDGGETLPFRATGRMATSGFFTMFDAPFESGRAWSPEEDATAAHVAVISSDLAQRLFPGVDALGRNVRLPEGVLRVVGVLAPWEMVPRVYDVSADAPAAEHVFLPLSTARALGIGAGGARICWTQQDGDDRSDTGPAMQTPAQTCAYLHYWAELPSAEDAEEYRDYLQAYSSEQVANGHFERAPNVRLRDVMQWLDHKHMVSNDVRLQMWLAGGFLLVCLINTVALLLAKFLRRGGEIGVRRALGARRTHIFAQCLVEAGLIGVAGGVLGLGFSALGLWLIRLQEDHYAQFVHADVRQLLVALALAVISSLLAGLLPAWRAMQVVPSLQLKSQ